MQYPTLLKERPLKVKDVAQMEREAHGKVRPGQLPVVRALRSAGLGTALRFASIVQSHLANHLAPLMSLLGGQGRRRATLGPNSKAG